MYLKHLTQILFEIRDKKRNELLEKYKKELEEVE